MKLKIKNIHPNIKWYLTLSRGRNHAVLMIDAIGLGNFKNYTKKIFKLNYKGLYYRQLNGSRWISEKDYYNLNKLLAEEIKRNPRFLYHAGLEMEKTGLKIIKLVDKYKNKNWDKASNKVLAKILEKFTDLNSQSWGGSWFYGYYFFFNETYLEKFKERLEKKLKNDFEKVWNYLIIPEKVTFIGRERLALLRLAKSYFKNKKISKKKIKEHVKKFAFVNKYYFWGQGFTFKEIEKGVKNLIAKGEKYINDELVPSKDITLNLDKFPLTKEEKLIIKGFKKIAYASNFADEAANYYTYHMRPFFEEIAQRLKISYEELVSMRFQEIKESLESGALVVPSRELKQRYKDHAIIFAKNKVYVLSGKELKEYKKLELKEERKQKIKELQGTVAFRGGIIKGKVRIIESNEEIKFFKKGEVLVTQMTNPTYLSAMQKSKAIITDEGGMLCHAAIVSRELRIPCVIGTKIATKILKNGDLVEVDAEKGVVRILKK